MQAWSEWDLPTATQQLKHWHKHPPTHRLVALYLDYKPAASAGANPALQEASESVVQGLMASAPELPEHLKPRLPYRKEPPHG